MGQCSEISRPLIDLWCSVMKFMVAVVCFALLVKDFVGCTEIDLTPFRRTKRANKEAKVEKKEERLVQPAHPHFRSTTSRELARGPCLGALMPIAQKRQNFFFLLHAW